MLFAPLIARLYSLDTTGAERTAQLHVMTVFTLLVPAADGVLRLHRARVARSSTRAAGSSPPRTRPSSTTSIVIGVLARVRAHDFGIAQRLDRRAAVSAATRASSLLLGAGTTAGVAAMALVLLPALRARADAPARRRSTGSTPAVRKMLRLSGWTIGYVVTNQIALLFVLVLAKSGTTGDVSAYLYAYAFYQVPHGLLAVSIMTTMMPELSSSAARHDLPELARKFRLGLRYIVLLDAARRGALRRARAADGGRCSCAAGSTRTTPPSRPTRSRRSRSGSCRSRVYLYTLRGFYALADTRTPF